MVAKEYNETAGVYKVQTFRTTQCCISLRILSIVYKTRMIRRLMPEGCKG